MLFAGCTVGRKMKHTPCVCGKRLYQCSKCTPKEKLCPHELNKFVCQICIRKRKQISSESKRLAAEVECFYDNELKRTMEHLKRHPKKMKKLDMFLEEQRIEGLSVIVSIDNGTPVEELVFNPPE